MLTDIGLDLETYVSCACNVHERERERDGSSTRGSEMVMYASLMLK